jgi:hypothetical protein
MSSLIEQLRAANRDLAAVRQRAQDQVILIERLKADRRNTKQAEALLSTFRDLLRKLEERRDSLARQAGDEETVSGGVGRHPSAAETSAAAGTHEAPPTTTNSAAR